VVISPLLEKSREATCNHPDLPAAAGVLSHHQRAGKLTVESVFGTPGVH
jgi:hypothetical protein